MAAELTGRKWIGSELDCSAIKARFGALEGDQEHLREIQANKNTLFTENDLKRRRKSGRPLPREYRIKSEHAPQCGCDPAPQGALFT